MNSRRTTNFLKRETQALIKLCLLSQHFAAVFLCLLKILFIIHYQWQIYCETTEVFLFSHNPHFTGTANLVPGKHWSTLCQMIPFLFVLEFHIKWYLSVSVLFLASFAQSNVFEIHPCLCMYQLFIHIFIAEYSSIV